MNSVGAVDHLLVIFRTTAGRGFLFALNRLTYGVLLQAHLRLNGIQICSNVLIHRLLDCFRLVSERVVVFPKGLGGFNGFAGGPKFLALLLCVGEVE